MKRILGMVALVIGVALIVGTMVVSLARNDQTIVKLSTHSDKSVFVTTAPGVLNLVNDDVKVTLDSPGNNVQWALGNPIDVAAYVGDAPATEVTGLASWKALKTTEEPGTDEASQVVTDAVAAEAFGLIGSDMWAEEGQQDSSASVELKAKDVAGKSLIATTDAGVAPEMTFEWVRIEDHGNPMVFYVIGALLALIGTFLLLTWYQEESLRRKSNRHSGVKLRSHVMDQPASVSDTSDDGELASADRSMQRERTGAALGAGIVPGTERSEMFRNRPLADSDRIVLVAEDPEDSEDVAEAEAPAEAEAEALVEAEAPVEAEAEAPVEAAASDEVEPAVDENWRSLWNFSWGSPSTTDQDKENHA